MKFLIKNKQNYSNVFNQYELFFIKENSFEYYFYNFDKYFIKNRKTLLLTKKGVSNNIKNNSKIITKNFSYLNNFIKLNTKKGNSYKIINMLNTVYVNFYNIFSNEQEYENLNNYSNYNYIKNILQIDFNNLDLNFLLKHLLSHLESVFEIKSKKNNKKFKNSKTKGKYIYEIVYIKKEKRFKYILRSLSLLNESFKKNYLVERIFWSFFLSLLNTKNSFLSKKKLFVYTKSIKFFKKNI